MTLKDLIRQQLKTIPPAVMNGGAMTAALWKQKAMKAQAIISKPNASHTDLETVLSELRNFK